MLQILRNCGVVRNFTIAEKLASIVSLKGTKRDSDLYTYLTDTLDKCELDLNNVSDISTDGSTFMVVQKRD